jgi:hypothetical protein
LPNVNISIFLLSGISYAVDTWRQFWPSVDDIFNLLEGWTSVPTHVQSRLIAWFVAYNEMLWQSLIDWAATVHRELRITNNGNRFDRWMHEPGDFELGYPLRKRRWIGCIA